MHMHIRISQATITIIGIEMATIVDVYHANPFRKPAIACKT
jgi:hypothetical protein